ncbi:MAG: MFS transporter [Candidatus Fonsibacter lacus]|nr:MFS transporter [Candidatus Fonsibacter lacus]
MLKILIFLFLDVLAFSGVLISTLPFLIHEYGGNILLITIIFGSFSFFQFFTSPFWGSLSDRFGRKPLIVLNCFAEILANLILAISGGLLMIFLSRIIAGLFKNNVSVGTAYIADITTKKNRAKGMGLFGVAFGLGFTVGPLKEVGIVMLYAGLSQIIVQGFILRILLKFFNEVQLIKSGILFLIFGFLLIPTSNIYLVPVAIFFLCYGIGVTNPCLNSLVSKKCSKNEKGFALGAAYSAQSISRFIGQPTAGILFLFFGKDMPFYVNSTILVLTIIFYLSLIKKVNK